VGFGAVLKRQGTLRTLSTWGSSTRAPTRTFPCRWWHRPIAPRGNVGQLSYAERSASTRHGRLGVSTTRGGACRGASPSRIEAREQGLEQSFLPAGTRIRGACTGVAIVNGRSASGEEDPSPPAPGTWTPGGSPFPPPSAIDPAGLIQTWRCGAPPAALGTMGRRTNEDPPEAGWRTATTPRKVELPSCPTAAPNVTIRSGYPTQLGGRQPRPCRRVVLWGNPRPGRKPRRAHTHGVDRGKAPRATNTSCVTGSLVARVEGLDAILTPRPLIPSVPLRPSENPPQTHSKDPRKTLFRHPQRTLGKPSPHCPGGQSQRRTAEASNTA